MKVTISIAQMRVKQSDPAANLKAGEKLAAEASRRKSDIICFPEMWTTGFDWAASGRLARESGKTLECIADMARRHRIWINGSILALNEENRPSNTSVLFDPGGRQAGVYRKIHLFGGIQEDKYIAAGNSLCVVDTPWGLSGLSICYDIRFPELFRAYALKGVKIVFSPMAFPHPKLEHWRALVRARAIEDQMYMAGANQVGSEDLASAGKVTYCGASCLIDPWGRAVAEAGETDEELLTAQIDTAMADDIRGKMSVLKDRRPELYG
ncbi:MAG: carbon-nitrogen family hydrolase [Candidatus Omnitrophota bacterium]